VADEALPPAAAGAPIGRRVVLGLFGTGVLGVLFGARVADFVARSLAPFTAKDGTGLSSLLPVGRFRLYTVTGEFPSRDRADYQLKVSGLVDTPLTLGFTDITSRPPVDVTYDFQCVTGWRVHDVEWRGIRLRDLLDEAGVQPTATAVRFHSFDGAYTESLTLEQARRDDVFIAYELEGEPLSDVHGGPVRLYVAPMYGYKSCKWLERIELTEAVIPGYWEEYGYDVDAWIGESNGRDDEPVS
jgi:DMSO/TMAO reductase YedYZ molybdopterin-dependent catalytic subunit